MACKRIYLLLCVQVRSSETDAFPFSSDQKLVDRVVEWEAKAAEQYKEDGIADGWDSDISEPENAEQRYIRVKHFRRHILEFFLRNASVPYSPALGSRDLVLYHLLLLSTSAGHDDRHGEIGQAQS